MSIADVPRRFGALRDRPSRWYLSSAGLSMLGDNNEHVLTYWVLWEEFHSPALVGFEVISHWLPFLVLSVPFGALAERYDCRRLIQLAQLLFMFVSISWGVLFLTGTLQIWEACVLLVLHGCAGALWGPAEQMLLHDYAAEGELPNIVRLNATFRGLGVLCGPVVGTLLLFGLGPVWGIFANALFYVPMTVLMLRAPYTGHTRNPVVVPVKRPRDFDRVVRTVVRDRQLLAMIVLSALSALFVGGSLQAAMPAVAGALGAGAGAGYGILLFANGIGGVVGGFLLEATNALRPTVRAAVLTTVALGVTTVAVAVTGAYAVAVVALLVGGVANLASQTVAQTIVQVRAPADQRGRIVGIFGMVSQGFRTGNGLILALVGTAIGVVPAVALSAALLTLGAVLVGVAVVMSAALSARGRIGVMSVGWSASDLEHIDAAEELEIAAGRVDGTFARPLPIWVVVVDGEVYVRTWHRRGGWFGRAVESGSARIVVPGVTAQVGVEDLGPAQSGVRTEVDEAYRRKYSRYGADTVGRMVSDEAAVTTLRLRPAAEA